MTVLQPYRFKHIGSFCLIFALAVFRPAAIWPEIPVSTAPLAVLAAWLLLLFKIYSTIGFIEFFKRHRTMIALITAYFLLCGASLIANYHRYPDTAAFVRWGLTFPIIQSALVACGFLFTLPQNEQGLSLTRLPGSVLVALAIATVIPVMAFWQIIDNKSAYEFYQYTVAGDYGNQNIVTRSLLATSTDLGAVSAIVSLCALLLCIYLVRTRQWLWASAALAIFALNAASGTMSGSRGFFLSIGVGILVLTAQWLAHHRRLLVLSLIPMLLMGIMALQFAPAHVLWSLHQGTPINASDLTLNLSASALGDRANLWQRAIEQTAEHPWLGISNGGYRLLNQSLGETPVNNVHNAFLQLGVDSGLGGLLIGLLLIFVLIRRAQGSAQLPLLAAVLAGLLVDNFADHSLSWIALTTFTLANCAVRFPTLQKSNARAKQIMVGLVVVSVVMGLGIFTRYLGKGGFDAGSSAGAERQSDLLLTAQSDQAVSGKLCNCARNIVKWTQYTATLSLVISDHPVTRALTHNSSHYEFKLVQLAVC
jgi:O-antigen ligase